MRFADAFKTATHGIAHAKVRSLLTMLGIVIGIASVIILMSIGASAQQLILNQVQSIGTNLIFVIPGGTGGSKFASPASAQGIVIKTLVEEDANSIRREPSILYVAPEVRGQAKAVVGSNDTTVTFEGTSEDFFAIRDFKLTSGRAFDAADVAGTNRVIVIGAELAKTLFGERTAVGKTLRLKDMTFTVIGVLEKKGLGPMGVDQDNLALIPITVAQKQMLGINYYQVLDIEAQPDYDIEFAKARVTAVLRQNHRVTDPAKDDFTIRTQADAVAILGSITSVMTAFLTSIAAISLIVGGIGIMNIMLVSVVERTKEIGLRKAVGATDADITQQFLLESVLLTGIGGLVGILCGAAVVGLAYLILIRVLDGGWVFELPLNSIFLALAVSASTGIAFGLYPARQAAKKSPIEALRYE